jgi:serine protease inhibitor
VYDRSVKSKKFIKKYIEENKIPQDHKVVVLAHFIYFYMHTGKWNWPCDRDKELSYPSEFIRMKNCQIVPDPTDYNSPEL